MNIIDAMIEANDRWPVRRRTWPNGDYVILNVMAVEGKVEIYYYSHILKKKHGYDGKRWEPTESDLLADDWETV